jgi:hypothetical protein
MAWERSFPSLFGELPLHAFAETDVAADKTACVCPHLLKNLFHLNSTPYLPLASCYLPGPERSKDRFARHRASRM